MIYDRETFGIAFDLQEYCVDPAFIFAIHPDPVVRVGAADEFDVGGLIQGIKIKIFRAGTIATTQLLGDDPGF
ncbi:MAG: hypothetical protein C3F07_06295 [Anaerolineales bacterium]|nr:MAG: hypothetical protein C3F07_06295 [Anaerolineales bacterium]